MSDCPHGMPSRGSCVECMEEGPVTEPPKWKPVDKPFVATFDGECPGCGEPIHERETIRRWDYGDKRTVYLHNRCDPPAVSS